MNVILLRHGATPGNLERRYIGTTDEPLSGTGRQALLSRHVPSADKLYVSPLRRCRETAAILYPEMPQIVIDGLRETNFGHFENHTYEELKDDPAYQAWLDSAGMAPPPAGESRDAVRERVTRAFLKITQECESLDRIALIIHGGTIMTLLEAFEETHRFYDWQVPNGGGWYCRWESGQFTNISRLTEQGPVPE